MNSLIYILRKTYKNTFKQIIKKPITLIGYLFFITLISLNSILSLFDKEIVEVTQKNLDLFTIIVSGFIMIIILPSLYQSINNFSLPLRNADVNFLFTAPISPAKILIYCQLIQSVASVFIAIIISIQAPLLKKTLGISFSSVCLLIISFIFMLISYSIIGICIYVLGRKFKHLKKILKYLFIVSITLLIIITIKNIFDSSNIYKGFLSFFNSSYYNYIPLIGWYKSLFEAVIYGIHIDTIISFILILITSLTSSILIYKLVDTSFYEVAITNSEKIERIKAAANKGENPFSTLFQNNKKRNKKINFTFSGKGYKVIIQKCNLEQRKKSKFYLDLKSLLVIVATFVVAYLIPKGEINDKSEILASVLIVNIYLLFFSSIFNNNTDLKKHYIYLIPVSIYKKLFAVSYYTGVKIFIDAFIPTILVALYYRILSANILLIPLIILAFAFQLYFIEIILITILGNIGTQPLQLFFKQLISMISLIPIIIIIFIFKNHPLTFLFTIVLIALLLISTGLFILAAQTFKKPEIHT